MSVKQLLHNYLSELKKKLESLPPDELGSIEFTNEEIFRVKNAINRGDPDYKDKQQTCSRLATNLQQTCN